MSLKPKEILKKKLAYFEETGHRTTDYPLLRAAYFEEVEKARTILENQPDQIKSRDPYTGLTPLHVAIFRGNHSLVAMFLAASNAELKVRDGFGRLPVDMLDYCVNQELFGLIIDATYPALSDFKN